MSQIQRNIQKLIRDKNYEILQNNNKKKKKLEKEIRQRRKKSTTTTTKKKKSSSPSNRVIKSRNSIRYFIRRDRIDKNDRLDHRLLSSAIVDYSILINHDDEQKFCRISNEKTTTTNDNNNKQDNESRIKESNKNDQDSDHSSSVDLDQNNNDNNNNDDAKHHPPCNGHGKTIDAKEDFLRMLDLVHKIDLEKMANCKKPRKRRTTANPQFSHAAIEAKRITQMEIANERRHRRRLALETKQQRRHSKQQNNNNKTLSSSSSSQQPNDYIKSINIFKPANEMFPGKFFVLFPN